MDETKLETLLEADDVLRAHRVRVPERFVEVFAIPAAELGGAVIDVVERATAFENALELAKLAHVATRVKRDFDIRAQAETYLVGLMLYVAGDDVMPAPAQLTNEPRAHRPQPARYKNAHMLILKIV